MPDRMGTAGSIRQTTYLMQIRGFLVEWLKIPFPEKALI